MPLESLKPSVALIELAKWKKPLSQSFQLRTALTIGYCAVSPHKFFAMRVNTFTVQKNKLAMIDRTNVNVLTSEELDEYFCSNQSGPYVQRLL